jgi:hypothetical protein
MRSRTVGALLCWLLFATVVAAQQTLQIAPLTRDGRVLVTLKLAEAFDDAVRATIQSGLTTSFIYDIELKRVSTMWLDRTIDSTTLTATVRFDNLTRRYHLTRTQDGRIDRADSTDREDEARVWLTEFERLPLFSSNPLEPNAEYYLRVRAHATPRSASFVWPWARHDVIGHVKFTFLK